MTKIPLLDLRAQYESVRSEMDAAIASTMEQMAFVMGPAVRDFEAAFATFLECPQTVACANGTDAIHIGLHALGIGPGDEVITVPNTFIATAEAISMARATPVFVDVHAASGLIDAARVEGAITPRTKAIVPVHLWGHVADMHAIMAIAGKHKLAVIEDTAQAHGARLRGKRAGTFGDAGTFSFYPGKNLGAYGDGGAMSFRDEALAKRCAKLRDHGRTDKYLHEVPGFNSRLDTLQAAVLLVKLKRLDAWNAARRRVASWYIERLASVPGLSVPRSPAEVEPVWHQFVICHPQRETVRTRLADAGIASGIHYPVPLHLQPAYRSLGLGEGSFPVAEKLSTTCLSLPMYPELTESDVDRIASTVRQAL